MKYGTRDLFWLTLLAALALFWWLDRQTLIRQHKLDRELDSIRNEIVRDAVQHATDRVLDKFRWKLPEDQASPSE
jgi:hypothetical protein